MRHLPMVASATLALVIAGFAGIIGTGAAPAFAACDPATQAVQYLHGVQMADGSIDGNLNETADYVLGAAADGVDPATLTSSAGKSPVDYFSSDLGGAQKSLQDANELGKLIQAVVAAHRNPRAFGGIDLLDRLRNGSTPGATPTPYYDGTTGTFLDAISGGQNQSFTQANAILGLAAAGDPGFPVPAMAASKLESLRSTSGASQGAWAAFGSFDTNTTSMALMALVAAGDTPATDATIFSDAFAYYLTQQDPASGGFTFTTDFGTTSDPDSDSFVIQALVAAGGDPAAAKWTNAKGNATTDVLTFQDPATGGFVFSTGGNVQAFATTGVVAGLRRAPLPIAGAFSAGAVLPATGCPAPPASAVKAAAAQAPHLPAAGARPSVASWSWPPSLALPAALLAGALAAIGLALRAAAPRRPARQHLSAPSP